MGSQINLSVEVGKSITTSVLRAAIEEAFHANGFHGPIATNAWQSDLPETPTDERPGYGEEWVIFLPKSAPGDETTGLEEWQAIVSLEIERHRCGVWVTSMKQEGSAYNDGLPLLVMLALWKMMRQLANQLGASEVRAERAYSGVDKAVNDVTAMLGIYREQVDEVAVSDKFDPGVMVSVVGGMTRPIEVPYETFRYDGRTMVPYPVVGMSAAGFLAMPNVMDVGVRLNEWEILVMSFRDRVEDYIQVDVVCLRGRDGAMPVFLTANEGVSDDDEWAERYGEMLVGLREVRS